MEISGLERKAPVIIKESVVSTNSLLKELALAGAEEGTVLIARSQSGGRGRMGRQFASPAGGLYLSMLLAPDCAPELLPSLAPCSALAVNRAIERLYGRPAGVKWPNDLLMDGKKICGILCESLFFRGELRAVLGVGLNVNSRSRDFEEELRPIAGSLCELTGLVLPLDVVCRELILRLDEVYRQWKVDRGSLLEEYRSACLSLGRELRLVQNGESRSAFAEDIDGDFALTVRYPDGSCGRIFYGEISLR